MHILIQHTDGRTKFIKLIKEVRGVAKGRGWWRGGGKKMDERKNWSSERPLPPPKIRHCSPASTLPSPAPPLPPAPALPSLALLLPSPGHPLPFPAPFPGSLSSSYRDTSAIVLELALESLWIITISFLFILMEMISILQILNTLFYNMNWHVIPNFFLILTMIIYPIFFAND